MIDNSIKLARPEIIAMKAYSSARSEAKSGNIFLDANENPWDDTKYNRYPEPQPSNLINKLALLYGVNKNQILVTRGSDEGIDLLVRLFCVAAKDNIMICPPTYGMYQVAATIQNAGVISAPLNKENGFSLDVDAIHQQWQENIKIIFLCSPNNPTGNVLNHDAIFKVCKLLDGKAIVVIDEAYIEFAETISMSRYLRTYPNLVILRTLSKAYGLAGIRCGATIANPEIISLLKKIIAPYPIPATISDIACQTIDKEKLAAQIAIINQEKIKIIDFLTSFATIEKVYPSQANFLLFSATNAQELMSTCLKHGIVIRDRSHELNLTNCLRLSIGTPLENQLFMEAIKNG